MSHEIWKRKIPQRQKLVVPASKPVPWWLRWYPHTFDAHDYMAEVQKLIVKVEDIFASGTFQ